VRVSAKADYAVRALIELAAHADDAARKCFGRSRPGPG
jgi:DNA-binding IscR family transcriptional regulator